MIVMNFFCRSTITGISLRQSLLLEEGCFSFSEIKSIQSRDNIVFCLSRNQIEMAASTRKVFVASVRAHTRNQKAAKSTSFPLPQDDVYTECPFLLEDLLCPCPWGRPWDVWGRARAAAELPRSSIAELSHLKLVHSNDGGGAFYYDAIHTNILQRRSSINMFSVCRWCM
ncbi:hypothetical protein MUK42_35668 [Musa troglodytarum]|uniref:Uncharacterized protein n=1 Tax=Musa troglodytarum TaxID=320322 RepID=A0A9E7KAP7_9LILI|nr:hypothetical protein MUK42_35668 [Musa troglodytarum]